MSIIVTVSSMIIPAIMLFIVGYGMIKKNRYCRKAGCSQITDMP